MSNRIEWGHERRKILLPVLILAPFPVTDLTGAEATALLDTGSTTSGISTKLAQSLKLVGLGKRPLMSAQGQGHAERFAFRVGLKPDRNEMNAFPFVFDEVIGIELNNALEFSALLGMDILGQCDFRMDRNGFCSLQFG